MVRFGVNREHNDMCPSETKIALTGAGLQVIIVVGSARQSIARTDELSSYTHYTDHRRRSTVHKNYLRREERENS